jgi:DNA polymerase-3 subunit alpha
MSTIINRCAGLIKERYGEIIDIYEIPQDDADVYELMSTDTSSDVFGLRSHEYHRLISQIHPTEIRHIEALHAMSTRLMFRKFAEYIKNKENSDRVEYYSEIEQTVLGETYGVLLYTDQIAELIHYYSGIPKEVSANIVKRFLSSNFQVRFQRYSQTANNYIRKRVYPLKPLKCTQNLLCTHL